jgi:predicted O-linked N-acetylglucosamine transferase (SPINDLY family)
MDYRVTDRVVEPDASYERYYTETLARMPECLWCYRPPADAAAVPPRAGGPVRFGSLNNYAKVGEEVVALWARLLLAVPDSRLVMVTVPEGGAQQALRERFAALGVSAERLELHGRLPAEAFRTLGGGIDIALDPFPCGGGTTTCETLWMGAPVITLIGETFLGRAGFSLLSAVGLAELAAKDADAYVAIAAGLAGDAQRLAQLRAGMRARMLASPLCDAPRYTRDFEMLYRQMWTSWCAKQ